jgi:hypothetical protein
MLVIVRHWVILFVAKGWLKSEKAGMRKPESKCGVHRGTRRCSSLNRVNQASLHQATCSSGDASSAAGQTTSGSGAAGRGAGRGRMAEQQATFDQSSSNSAWDAAGTAGVFGSAGTA